MSDPVTSPGIPDDLADDTYYVSDAVWGRSAENSMYRFDFKGQGNDMMYLSALPFYGAIAGKNIENSISTPEEVMDWADHALPIVYGPQYAFDQGVYYSGYIRNNNPQEASWASWIHPFQDIGEDGQVSMRRFSTNITLDKDDLAKYDFVSLVSKDRGESLDSYLPINDDLYVFVNGRFAWGGGVSFRSRIPAGFEDRIAPTERAQNNIVCHFTDGWYIDTLKHNTVTNLHDYLVEGNNRIDIFTDDTNIGGGFYDYNIMFSYEPVDFRVEHYKYSAMEAIEEAVKTNSPDLARLERENRLVDTADLLVGAPSYPVAANRYARDKIVKNGVTYTYRDASQSPFAPSVENNVLRLYYDTEVPPVVEGKLTIKKESNDGKVGNIRFTISGNGSEWVRSTDANGVIELTLPVGSYTVTESVPAGYVNKEPVQNAVITKDQKNGVELTFKNEKLYSVQLKKTGFESHQQYLKDQTFTLKLEGGGLAEPMLVKLRLNDSSEKIYLPVGRYTLTELPYVQGDGNPFELYDIHSNLRTGPDKADAFGVFKDGAYVFEITEKGNIGTQAVITVVNKAADVSAGRITLKKEARPGDSFGDRKFTFQLTGILADKTNGKPDQGQGKIYGPVTLDPVKAGGDAIVLPSLPYGEYTLTEIIPGTADYALTNVVSNKTAGNSGNDKFGEFRDGAYTFTVNKQNQDQSIELTATNAYAKMGQNTRITIRKDMLKGDFARNPSDVFVFELKGPDKTETIELQLDQGTDRAQARPPEIELTGRAYGDYTLTELGVKQNGSDVVTPVKESEYALDSVKADQDFIHGQYDAGAQSYSFTIGPDLEGRQVVISATNKLRRMTAGRSLTILKEASAQTVDFMGSSYQYSFTLTGPDGAPVSNGGSIGAVDANDAAIQNGRFSLAAGGKGAVFSGLPYGKYTLTEAVAGGFEVSDATITNNDGTGEPGRNVRKENVFTFTVDEHTGDSPQTLRSQGGASVLTITNRLKTMDGKLSIRKAASAEDAAYFGEQGFEFSLVDSNNKEYIVNPAKGTPVGGTLDLPSLPYGVYTLTEKSGENYTVASIASSLKKGGNDPFGTDQGGRYTFTIDDQTKGEIELTVTNQRGKMGNGSVISIQKGILKSDFERNPAEVFLFELSGPNNISRTIELQPGQLDGSQLAPTSFELKGMPYGLYTLREVGVRSGDKTVSLANSRFTLQSVASDWEIAKGAGDVLGGTFDGKDAYQFSIGPKTEGQHIVIMATNALRRQSQKSLLIQKAGNDVKEYKPDYSYRFTLEGLDGQAVPEGSFTLKAGGEAKEFRDLPYGRYALTEQIAEDADYYLDTVAMQNNGSGPDRMSRSENTFTFVIDEKTSKDQNPLISLTNKMRQSDATIKIVKAVDDKAYFDGDKFMLTLTGPDGRAIPLGKNNPIGVDGEITLPKLKYGEYTLSEEQGERYLLQSVVSDSDSLAVFKKDASSYTFRVDGNTKDARLTVENVKRTMPQGAKVVLKKTSPDSAGYFLDQHGNAPTFRFQLTGDGGFYKEVGLKLGEMISFEGLAYGEYTLKEVVDPDANYTLSGMSTAGTIGGAVTNRGDQGVTFVVGPNAKNGDVLTITAANVAKRMEAGRKVILQKSANDKDYFGDRTFKVTLTDPAGHVVRAQSAPGEPDYTALLTAGKTGVTLPEELPFGNYTLTEALGSDYELTGVTATNGIQNGSRAENVYTFTIDADTASGGDAVIELTNAKKMGDGTVTIQKTGNEKYFGTTPFEITVTGPQGFETVKKSIPVGGSFELKNLPYGVYTITEAPGENFTLGGITSDPADFLTKTPDGGYRFAIGDDTKRISPIVSLYNVEKTSSQAITVRKASDDDAFFKSQSFQFTLDGPDAHLTERHIIRVGESFELSNLPYGTYTLRETIGPNANFGTPSIRSNQLSGETDSFGKDHQDGSYTFTIDDRTKDVAAVITVTNTKKLSEGTITFEKQFDGASYVSAETAFTFRIVGDNGYRTTVSPRLSADGRDGSVKLSGLPYGSYTISEEIPNGAGYEFVRFDDGGSGFLTGGRFTIDDRTEDQNVKITATNRMLLNQGEITLTKQAEGDNRFGDTAFTFSLSGGPEGFRYDDFSLKIGERKTLGNLPYGVYTLTEKADDGSVGYELAGFTDKSGAPASQAYTFTVSSQNTALDITATNRQLFSTGKVSIRKLAEDGSYFPKNQAFEFKLEGGPTAYPDAVTAYLNTEGAEGRDAVLTNLPYGTYTLTEVGGPGYELAGFQGGTEKSYQFTIDRETAAQDLAITATNRSIRSTGAISITKVMDGQNYFGNAPFQFNLRGDNGFSASYSIPVGTTFSLPSGLPFGAYTLTESAGAGGFRLTGVTGKLGGETDYGSFENQSYAFTIDQNSANQELAITATNAPVLSTGTITLAKAVKGDNYFEGREFKFTLTSDNGYQLDARQYPDQKLTVTAGGQIELPKLPYGRYTLSEVTGADFSPVGFTDNLGEGAKFGESTDANHYTFVIDQSTANQSVNLTATNEAVLSKGVITLKKAALEGQNFLGGKTFTFTLSGGPNGFVPRDLTLAVGESADLSLLPYGDYTLTERIAADEDFVLTEMTSEGDRFGSFDGKTYSFSIDPDTAEKSMTITATNRSKTGTITIHKTGSDGKNLQATFEIVDRDGRVMQTVTTDAISGIVKTAPLPLGAYTLKETVAPDGYDAPASPAAIAISQDGADYPINLVNTVRRNSGGDDDDGGGGSGGGSNAPIHIPDEDIPLAGGGNLAYIPDEDVPLAGGFPIGLLAIGGGVLILAGLSMRRKTRRDEADDGESTGTGE